MASTLNRTRAAEYAEQVLAEGTEVISPDVPDKGGNATKLISFRLNEYDHRRVKALFAHAGISMGTGCALASRYLADLIERGKVDVSRSGIIPK